jgi:hypothetical protein
MMKPRWLYLVTLATILAGMPARAAAQWSWTNDKLEKKLDRSHLVDPARFGLPTGDTEELFQQRLRSLHSKEIEALRNKYSQKPAQLDQLISKNPELVQKFLRNFKMDDLPPELRSRFAGREAEFEKFIRSMTLRDFLRYARAADGLNVSPDTGEQPADGNPTASPPTSAEKPGSPSDLGATSRGEATPQDPGTSETTADESSANSVWGRWLLDAADRFKNLDPALRNSSALRKAIRDLGRKIDGVDEQWQKLDHGANALAEKWARLGQALPLNRLWPEKGVSWPRSLTPQSLPKWRWPQAGGRSGRPIPRSIPQPVPSTIIQSDRWRSLGMLAIFAGLALLLWKVLRRGSAGGPDQRTSVWKLGPWPVDPAGVRTREELIRAFEYLSVLRLGPAARHWHHLAIAFGLGGSASHTAPLSGWGDPLAQRRQAAEELASLYEQARYAPPGDALSESALATARRNLCLLAGVPNS